MQTPDTQRESHSEGDYDAMISLWMLHYGFSIAVRAPLALVLTAIWISLAARYDLWQISALLFIEGVHWWVLEVFTMEIGKKKMWRGTFEVVLFRVFFLFYFFFFNNDFFFQLSKSVLFQWHHFVLLSKSCLTTLFYLKDYSTCHDSETLILMIIMNYH